MTDTVRSARWRGLGVLLVVLCFGVAAGAQLGGRGSEPWTRPTRVAAPVSRVPTAPAPASPAALAGDSLDTAVSDGLVLSGSADSASAIAGTWGPAGGRYTPLVGATAPAPIAEADTLASAPAAVSSDGGRQVAVSSVDSSPDTAAEAPRARSRERPDVGDPGPIDAAPPAGSTVLLGVQRPGGRVVLYETGSEGEPGLPADIAGRWAWVGTCRVFRIDLSQRRGPAGAVRGIGRGGDVQPRTALAVPASWCAGHRSRGVPAGASGVTVPGGVTLEAVRSEGGATVVRARTESGVSWSSSGAPWPTVRAVRGVRAHAGDQAWDAWFVAFEGGGSPRAFLRVSVSARGSVSSQGWVPLGGGRAE
jgi:hypothetical protein